MIVKQDQTRIFQGFIVGLTAKRDPMQPCRRMIGHTTRSSKSTLDNIMRAESLGPKIYEIHEDRKQGRTYSNLMKIGSYVDEPPS